MASGENMESKIFARLSRPIKSFINREKPFSLEFGDKMIYRLAIKTQIWMKGDDPVKIVKEACEGVLGEIDTDNIVVAVSEKAVSCSQGRAVLIDEINPGALAKFLSKRVTKTPVGIGLGIPETMQLAINEVGVPRILLATAASALTRPFGMKGVFYMVAGQKARSVDGPTEYVIPPYNKYAVMGAQNADQVCRDISKALGGKRVVIIDANDIGRRFIGTSGNVSDAEISYVDHAFADNPLCNASEQTPIGIVVWEDK